MQNKPSPSEPPYFYELCDKHSLDAKALDAIAGSAGIAPSIVENMYMHTPIHRVDAAKVLLAFSQYVKQAHNVDESYTLENTRVALFPTFQDLHQQHIFDIGRLAMHAGVPGTIPDDMLADRPVPIHYARQVLQMASWMTSGHYTLDTVDVAIEEVSRD